MKLGKPVSRLNIHAVIRVTDQAFSMRNPSDQSPGDYDLYNGYFSKPARGCTKHPSNHQLFQNLTRKTTILTLQQSWWQMFALKMHEKGRQNYNRNKCERYLLFTIYFGYTTARVTSQIAIHVAMGDMRQLHMQMSTCTSDRCMQWVGRGYSPLWAHFLGELLS